jgi:hypothetical protein
MCLALPPQRRHGLHQPLRWGRAMGPYLKTNPWIWVIGVFAVLIVIGALTG